MPKRKSLKPHYTQMLLKWGMSSRDITSLFRIVHKFKPPEEQVNSFYKEMEQGIPFEGGMGFLEAMIGLKEGYNE